MVINQRMCINCRERKDKSLLFRVVKTKEGEVFVSETNKDFGRGAHICKNVQCIEGAKKKNALSRAFKMKAPDSVFDKMLSLIGDGKYE